MSTDYLQQLYLAKYRKIWAPEPRILAIPMPTYRLQSLGYEVNEKDLVRGQTVYGTIPVWYSDYNNNSDLLAAKLHEGITATEKRFGGFCNSLILDTNAVVAEEKDDILVSARFHLEKEKKLPRKEYPIVIY